MGKYFPHDYRSFLLLTDVEKLDKNYLALEREKKSRTKFTKDTDSFHECREGGAIT